MNNRFTRTLPIATEHRSSDRYAGRRILNVSEVKQGDAVEHIATGRTVVIQHIGSDWLEAKGARGPLFIRKVSCFARIENGN
jgi:hypothetical protein